MNLLDHLRTIARAEEGSLHRKTVTFAATAPSDRASGQAIPIVPRFGNQPPPHPAQEASGVVTTGAAHAANDVVFEPRVRGPDDPPSSSAQIAQASTRPAIDGADLRLEQDDDALVF